jgi:putative transposase
MFDTRTEATATIGGCTDWFYNPIRRHSALAFRSPIQYEMMAVAAAQ